ncbi:hypothetical protein SLS62_009231 [Diatrype stigma]|uniref:Uncharacterized protein n=1 Tax=Diatrype stigma TaxID=117547 RepID=A0AAN9UFG9_9PEZI
MKLSSVISYILAGAATSAALPTENAVRSVADLVTSKMTWTGQVKPGEAAVSITGTAGEIYHRIVAINPNYDNELGLNSTDSSTMQRRDLAHIGKRATTSSDWTCNYGTDVAVEPIGDGVRYLYSIGTGSCSAPAGSPGAGGCTAASCNSGAGIWLCNDANHQVDIPCTLIAE